jgi:hypothetical protein
MKITEITRAWTCSLILLPIVAILVGACGKTQNGTSAESQALIGRWNMYVNSTDLSGIIDLYMLTLMPDGKLKLTFVKVGSPMGGHPYDYTGSWDFDGHDVHLSYNNRQANLTLHLLKMSEDRSTASWLTGVNSGGKVTQTEIQWMRQK